MIKVAFTLIGGNNWIGGLNYQVNLLSALLNYEQERIQPVLFLGEDTPEEILERFQRIQGLKIVHSAAFNQQTLFKRLFLSIGFGKDFVALRLFERHQVDIVFEAANFYGWRFPISTIAWIPDLQHQRLRHYFSYLAFWKREMGFRFQVWSGRHLMLSSEDARKDFNDYYNVPSDRLHVVSFSVPVATKHFDRESLLNKYHLPPKFFYLPNQFWRHKNHECVIKALAIAKQSGVAPVVAVSGNTADPRDPSYFEKLMDMATKLGVKENFKVLGLIPYEDVQPLMQSCITLINPSRFEGWSTTVEEAKSLGIEMLLSDLPVHREQAGISAKYFDVDDAEGLAKLLIDFINTPLTEKSQSSTTSARQSYENMSNFAASFTDMVEKVAWQ